jgi:hypothetical protein
MSTLSIAADVSSRSRPESFIKWIPIVVPLFAVLIAAMGCFIGWAVL